MKREEDSQRVCGSMLQDEALQQTFPGNDPIHFHCLTLNRIPLTLRNPKQELNAIAESMGLFSKIGKTASNAWGSVKSGVNKLGSEISDHKEEIGEAALLGGAALGAVAPIPGSRAASAALASSSAMASGGGSALQYFSD